MVRKIQLCALILFTFLFSASVLASPVDKILNANPDFNSAIISISVKDEDGVVLYEKNSKTLVHPASTLKLITSAGVIDFLGKDYEFNTVIYKKLSKTYLKLSGDPLFSYQDMLQLADQYKSRNTNIPKTITVDDNIVDKIPFGIGWQWDDNANIHFPQLSPYVVNRNLFALKARIGPRNTVVLESTREYKENIVNKLHFGNSTNIQAERNLFDEKMPIVLTGMVNSNQTIYVPAKNPQKFFNNLFSVAFGSKIKFKSGNLPKFSKQEALVSHSLSDVMKQINTYSDNLAAELLLKTAGAVKTNTTGTTLGGLEIVENYYSSKGVDFNSIQLVDASGVSMNDYVTSDFMTDALIVINNSRHADFIKSSMSDGLNGTFKGRLMEFNGKLKVKTGTLANTSSVVGFMTTTSGKKLVFSIILDNLPKNVNPKDFENKIIRAINSL